MTSLAQVSISGRTVVMCMRIEAYEEDRYGVFSTKEAAQAWAEQKPDCAHIFSEFIVDVPEFGNETQTEPSN